MVSVAVLVIPWLLSRPGIDANVTRTAGKKIFRAEIVPLTGAAVENTTPAALLDAAASAGQGGKPSVPATSSTGWTVQVGTFSEQANADSLSAVLAGNGFTAHKTALGGNATRIWLGPYAKKETAGEVSRRLQALTGEKGFVTKHAP